METVTLNFGKRKTFNSSRLFRSIFADSQLLTIAGCLFIAAVSIHDTYLVTVEPMILNMEKNPICKALIKMDPHYFSFFICGKMTGMLAVIGTLLFFHRIRYSRALLITGAVVTFQGLLLIYLHLSDPLIGDLPNFALLFQAGR